MPVWPVGSYRQGNKSPSSICGSGVAAPGKGGASCTEPGGALCLICLKRAHGAGWGISPAANIGAVPRTARWGHGWPGRLSDDSVTAFGSS